MTLAHQRCRLVPRCDPETRVRHLRPRQAPAASIKRVLPPGRSLPLEAVSRKHYGRGRRQLLLHVAIRTRGRVEYPVCAAATKRIVTADGNNVAGKLLLSRGDINDFDLYSLLLPAFCWWMCHLSLLRIYDTPLFSLGNFHLSSYIWCCHRHWATVFAIGTASQSYPTETVPWDTGSVFLANGPAPQHIAYTHLLMWTVIPPLNASSRSTRYPSPRYHSTFRAKALLVYNLSSENPNDAAISSA